MDFFDYLYLFGGLSLFLFGMKFLSSEAQTKSGEKIKAAVTRFTENKYRGFLFGMTATAVLQSSSAVTAAVTDFVGTGVVPFENAAGIIIGSNVGTTVTSWLIGLAGANKDIPFFRFLNTVSLASVFSITGIILYNSGIKNEKRKNAAGMLFGFAVIMYGLYFMTESAFDLKNEEWAVSLFSELSKPAAGFLAGVIVTAVVQSSSVSVGVLQAVSVTGAFSLFSCVPIILGQNVGACVTALAASASGGKKAKAAALIHLYFNLFSSALFYLLLLIAVKLTDSGVFYAAANGMNIALAHTAFNFFAAAVMLPLSSLLQKAALKTVKKC